MTDGEVGNVRIFDTTLRDGEQAPGIALSKAEKVEIAEQLARLNVDILEAGFPISSPGEFDAVAEIASSVKGPVIAALARTATGDIERAAEALKGADRWRIHTFISTSDVQRESMLKMSPQQVLDAIRENVSLAKSYTDDVEFSAQDATRTPLEFLMECFQCGRRLRRHDDQRARHGGLRDADGVRRADPHRARRHARRRRDLDALPQRPGARGGELAGRHRERGGPGRGGGQRDRRAGRQLLAGGDRDGRAHARPAPRQAPRSEHQGDHADLEAGRR